MTKTAMMFDSRTGNTRQLAEIVTEVFGEKMTVDVNLADIIFVGSWCDKGTLSDEIKKQISDIKNKKIFVFATCGFGADEKYYTTVLNRMTAEFDDSNMIIGGFVCQGKMPEAVRERYAAMSEKEPEEAKWKTFLTNFDIARSHPDEDDINRFKAVLERLKKQYE